MNAVSLDGWIYILTHIFPLFNCRAHKPSTDEDYGIDDLRSDDSSDDEDAPRKKVPSWAKGQLPSHMLEVPALDWKQYFGIYWVYQ